MCPTPLSYLPEISKIFGLSQKMGLLSKKLFLDGVQHRKAGTGPEMIRENFSSLEALHTCFDVGFSLFLFSTQIFFVRFLVTVCSY